MILEGKLLIAAISAGSAIAGALLSQIVTVVRDWLDKKHQRNTLLRDKYEELANLVSSSQEWASSLGTAESLKDLQERPPVPARKAMVLSYIYFPRLRAECEKLLIACVAMQNVLIDNHGFNPDINCGTQAVLKNSQAVESASRKFSESRQDLDEKIIKYAGRYAKA